ncbi:molybdopterin-dependent oxidoreductase [Herbiconiux solani]|uniref:molybdopterin-dependent oxidoreductase n=1 Tax=Herbiconiux solani TaxID=661329 RepID=UPI000825DE1B|nr:molybdopterin-dependent oxidoreductase [Herbiconiux solani]
MQRLLSDLRRVVGAPARNPRSAVVLGRLLGIAFLVCFGTGLYSHFLQEPLPWMRFPTQPTQLYQFTQGLHITAGIACFPLILGKLYAVFPELFQTPPLKGVVHLLERASIAIFVGASLVQITIGLLNTYQWYPWPFGFREVHFALSFVIIGSLAIHIGVKLPIISRYWTKNRARMAERADAADVTAADADAPASATDAADAPAFDAKAGVAASRASASGPAAHRPARGLTGRLLRWIDGTPAVAEPGVDRRGFFALIGVATAAVVGLTAGQSFAFLSPVNAFAPRAKDIGPQGVPINRTAAAAQITAEDVGPSWVLSVTNGDRMLGLTRDQLLAMPQSEVDLPISCVEGWSQLAHWKGVRIRDLAAAVGAATGAALTVTSLEKEGGYRIMQMGPEYVSDPTTLVALELNGETLDIDHGYPARIIAPGRPGVLQTKWLTSLEVS